MTKRKGALPGAPNPTSYACHYSSDSALRQFSDEVYSQLGAVLPLDISSGDLVRFDDPEKPRGNSACWALFFDDSRPTGVAGNWRTGHRFTWCAGSKDRLTWEEKQRLNARFREARAARDAERRRAQDLAAKEAQWIWEASEEPEAAHPYLIKKQVEGLGLRQHRTALLVPIHNVDGELRNLQQIFPNGSKRFLKGGEIKACFAVIGELKNTAEVLITEGYATAETLYRQLQRPVLASMSANNLSPVAETIRTKYPGAAITVACDFDHLTEGNPGLREGRKAAKAVDGCIIWPTLCRRHDCGCTDFNDASLCPRVA